MVDIYKLWSSVGVALFEYNTGKIVHIRNKKVGFINRFIQLLIIGYVIGYAIIYKKGYQKTDDGLSSVTTKVKGIAYTNLSIPVKYKNGTVYYHQGPRAWDSADYVTPAEEYGAVFVMTNMILTPEQKQKKCPDNVPAARCTSDSNCTEGTVPKNGHGVMTGKCVLPDNPVSGDHKMCEIHGWCPVENNKLPMPGRNFDKPLSNKSCLFKEAENFTIFIKNTVRFPLFEKSTRNINDELEENHLENCEYNHDHNRLCPIFRLKTIFDEISDTAFNDIAITGGVVAIKITWDCNLDCDIKNCLPRYNFFRLDNRKTKVSPGYNLRIAQYDTEGKNKKVQRRTLIKAYGIRFVIMVDAKAGQLKPVPLLQTIGAGLGLLGLATVLCDICVLYFLKKRTFYREHKYFYVDADQIEDQSTIQESSGNPTYAMFDNAS